MYVFLSAKHILFVDKPKGFFSKKKKVFGKEFSDKKKRNNKKKCSHFFYFSFFILGGKKEYGEKNCTRNKNKLKKKKINKSYTFNIIKTKKGKKRIYILKAFNLIFPFLHNKNQNEVQLCKKLTDENIYDELCSLDYLKLSTEKMSLYYLITKKRKQLYIFRKVILQTKQSELENFTPNYFIKIINPFWIKI
ncbi:hypothetical protein RFI_03382 [Reticulomyxa filosa]|uniref:Uncharacterized protein n=1 Tax=Reticulomyxa filosa TaxID=46433 RepID=X6P6A5_RETFI|nr:hypothetical protein RFI_03382 [Reticulomyxa filosa]|eukprot:ETO33721.1 hypothetical protein RFI_03382 [Reticulomyxa filosa]